MLHLLPDRLATKVAPNPQTGCWEWAAYRRQLGYGEVRWQGQVRLAHRAVYEALIGPIPEGLELDHLCRNPACVNPDHLEPVTHAENVRRADLSGNGALQRARTHCPKGHPYSGTNLLTRVNANGRARRDCRACHQEVSLRCQQARRARRRAEA